jgi:dTDP-3-amino-2,3,6-trideoxy-4-keto-D-glucose/dTDP-3-amino-3,4,6-trideoxy-alpha-D-glucose/dTDP-2,6-dideoxy-D-kanosamine transaminase
MESRVPLNDLSRLGNSLKQEISERVARLSISGNYILGPEVEAFESKFANYLSVVDCVGVASGTDALTLSLLAIGLTEGDTVLTMANAGAYSTVAARAIGAEPIFVDVSETSLQMSVREFEKSLGISIEAGLNPKAVIITHLFGQLNKDVEEIVQLARKAGLLVIEDCSQATGAKNASGLAGSFGDLSTFSFYPTKNLGASGDGGAVAGGDRKLTDKIRKLRQYGWGRKYHLEAERGRNSRLDELQAAILLTKLPHLDDWNQKRRDIFQSYVEQSSPSVRFFSHPDQSYVGHLAPITVNGMTQSQLEGYFEAKGIQTSVHFPIPDHKQKLMLKHKNLVPLPVTEHACSSHVTLPIFPEMTELEISRVCEALSKVSP